MKIKDNSDFIKNKKLSHVFSKIKQNIIKKPTILNKNNTNNNIIPSTRYYNITKHSFINKTIIPNDSYNFTNNFNVLKTNSLSNDKRFFKSLMQN